MKLKSAVSAIIMSAALSGVAYSAGGPMNEDLSALAVPTQKAIEAGKAGNKETLLKEAGDALAQAKQKTDSASQQRIVRRLKMAIAKAEQGNVAEATQDLEEGITDMKKAPPPKFGGGS